VLPLQFVEGENTRALGLDGSETYDIDQVGADMREIAVAATGPTGERKRFRVRVRVDTPKEWDYYRHGGILLYVIRQLVG
jgi:aconitate hydratase